MSRSYLFMAAIAVLFASVVAEQKCVQHGAEITITSEDDIRNVSDVVFVTCMDGTKSPEGFDLTWDDGQKMKVTGSAASKVVEATFSESGKKIHLSVTNMKDTTKCRVQIGTPRPFNCSIQGKDEEDKSNLGVLVGVPIAVLVVLVVVVAIIIYIWKRFKASRSHTGYVATLRRAAAPSKMGQCEIAELPEDQRKVDNGSGQAQQHDPLTQPGGSGPMESSDVRAGNGVGTRTVRINHDTAGAFAHPPEAVAALGRRRMNR